MGKCFGCNKKLGLFEGYSTKGVEFCKECYLKKEVFLEKKEAEEKRGEKEEKEKWGKKEKRREFFPLLNRFHS